jgi:DivIVA domain-containing protein
VELNRQSIERRDFPMARRGYEPAAVDAHLRAVAEQAQELAQRAEAAAEPSLSSTAAAQVQGILEAAQTTASAIKREAEQDAQRTREEAAQEVERASAHVETLARASAALLGQVESLDGEVSALAQSLRAGGEVSRAEEEEERGGAVRPAPATVAEGGQEIASSAGAPALGVADASVPAPGPAPVVESVPAPGPAPQAASDSEPSFAAASAPQTDAGTEHGGDLDGARLVALNMALNGEPREQTDRYLADSFQLADRAKLLDEVYAAIEG